MRQPEQGVCGHRDQDNKHGWVGPVCSLLYYPSLLPSFGLGGFKTVDERRTGGSDYMSFTRMGYPSAFAKESDFAIENPYVHTVRDQMDLDDETGIYSIEVSTGHPA